MKPLHDTLIALLLLLATHAQAADTDDFPGIRALMTDAQFRAAGLEKLSREELEALDDWLIGYTVGEAEVVRATSEEVKEAEEAFEVTASIKPPFDGWDGETVFYLDNGQVWKQRVQGRYQYDGDDTRVVIRKGLFGFKVMELVATGQAIGVTRIR
jgi:hypothetical protein